MQDIIVVGSNDGIQFTKKIEGKLIFNALAVASIGDDSDAIIEAQSKIPDQLARECVTAMCWESEDFISKMITLLEDDGRFAICHEELEFGVSTTSEQAINAWVKEEF